MTYKISSNLRFISNKAMLSEACDNTQFLIQEKKYNWLIPYWETIYTYDSTRENEAWAKFVEMVEKEAKRRSQEGVRWNWWAFWIVFIIVVGSALYAHSQGVVGLAKALTISIVSGTFFGLAYAWVLRK